MSYSVGSITTFVMPHMQNVRGDLFGGPDGTGGSGRGGGGDPARRGSAVTASIDRVDFRERIPVGALVTCIATVDYVGEPRWTSPSRSIRRR